MYVDNKPDLLELYHHGIKDQQWGVKNGPPYPLDRETKRKAYGDKRDSKKDRSSSETKKQVVSSGPQAKLIDHTNPNHPNIPEGKKFYRTSLSKSDLQAGKPIYVTYDDTYDRHYYKSYYTEDIKQHGNVTKDTPVYEQTMSNKKPLKVASYEQVSQVAIDQFCKDEKMKREVGKAHFDDFIKNSGWRSLDEYMEKEVEQFVLGYKLTESQRKKYIENQQKFFSDTILDEASKGNKNARLAVAQSFGSSQYAKQSVIKELQKRGYNSMVDVAGVGSVGEFKVKGRGYEGNDPLIVFDSSIFSDLSSHEITASESKASKRITNKENARRQKKV